VVHHAFIGTCQWSGDDRCQRNEWLSTSESVSDWRFFGCSGTVVLTCKREESLPFGGRGCNCRGSALNGADLFHRVRGKMPSCCVTFFSVSETIPVSWEAPPFVDGATSLVISESCARALSCRERGQPRYWVDTSILACITHPYTNQRSLILGIFIVNILSSRVVRRYGIILFFLVFALPSLGPSNTNCCTGVSILYFSVRWGTQLRGRLNGCIRYWMDQQSDAVN